jgi:hypothetical protein
MQVLKQNDDGSAVIELTKAELLALGVGIWVAGDDDYVSSFMRFCPNDSERAKFAVTNAEFNDTCRSVRASLLPLVDEN